MDEQTSSEHPKPFQKDWRAETHIPGVGMIYTSWRKAFGYFETELFPETSTKPVESFGRYQTFAGALHGHHEAVDFYNKRPRTP